MVADQSSTQDGASQVETATAGIGSREATVRLAIWGLSSVAFVAFLLLGSVPARIWQIVGFGSLARWELFVHWKPITRIWKIQADTLPDVPQQWLLQGIFYGCLLLFVAGSIWAARMLIMDTPNDQTSSETNL